MTTRRALEGAPLKQERYSSDPLYVEARGVGGTAVTAKASLLWSPRKRSLLYFLQSISLEQGGFKRLAAEILKRFPDRVGTPTMHLIRKKPGKLYSEEEARRIDAELEDRVCLLGQKAFKTPYDRLEFSPSVLKDQCLQAARKLDEFLVELCVNPRLEIRLPEDDLFWETERENALEKRAVDWSLDFKAAQVPYFRDIVGALIEYQDEYERRRREQFVETSISRQVFSVLNYSLANRKWSLLRGNPGIGKTESLKAWCDIHRGEARYVSLTGINHRIVFFRELAKAFGLPHTAGLSAAKVQARVEDFLENSRLLLVIDEGQYLWPQQKRIHSHPEFVNWLMTACFNRGVPIVISATLDFDRRRRAVEAQTTWSAEQLSRRIKRAVELPAVPTREDLEAVATARLPGAPAPLIKYLAGYAMTSKRYFDSIEEAIEDARSVAQSAGRDRITFADVKEAIAVYRVPSDEALKRACDDEAPKLKAGRPRPALPVQGPFTEGSEDNFAGSTLAGNVRTVTPGTANRTPALQPA